MKKIIINNLIAFFALLSMFIFQVIQGVDKAGRWQYAEYSAMAERLISGEGVYSNLLLNEYSLQGIYFPGVSYFIAALKVTLPLSDPLILALMVALSTALLFISLFKLSIKFGSGATSIFLSLAISFSLFFDFFLFYLTEGKADSLLISLSIFILLLVDSIFKYGRVAYRKLLLLLLLFVFLGVIKQQSLAIFSGFFIYLFFNNNYPRRIRIIIGSIMILAGLLILAIVFSNDNAYLITIKVPASHQFAPFLDSAKMIFEELKNSWFYVSMVMASIFVNYKKIINSELLKMWLIVSIMFFIISIISFLKEGGNAGNLQSGMVIFMPFFTLMVEILLKNSSKFKAVITFILLISIVKNTMLAFNSYVSYLSNSQERFLVQKFLKENFSGSRVVFRSDDYFILKKSGLIPVDNYDIYSQARNATNQSQMTVDKGIDIIYGVDMQYINYDDFVKFKANNMPEKLINNIYIRKK
jgi:hypothetical protein